MFAVTKAIQALSISISLYAGGGIAALSIFDIPELRSQPADRSLPMLRWLFSRGGHIFPQAGVRYPFKFEQQLLTTPSGGLLCRLHVPGLRCTAQQRAINVSTAENDQWFQVNGYLAAALLALSIAPFTSLLMIPNNFAIIKKNEELGGARSVNAAKALKQSGFQPGQRSAEDSVNSKGEGSELFDRSGPQTKTNISSREADDQEVHELLSKFGRYNMVRAVLLVGGGVVGLLAALS